MFERLDFRFNSEPSITRTGSNRSNGSFPFQSVLPKNEKAFSEFINGALKARPGFRRDTTREKKRFEKSIKAFGVKINQHVPRIRRSGLAEVLQWRVLNLRAAEVKENLEAPKGSIEREFLFLQVKTLTPTGWK